MYWISEEEEEEEEEKKSLDREKIGTFISGRAGVFFSCRFDLEAACVAPSPTIATGES